MKLDFENSAKKEALKDEIEEEEIPSMLSTWDNYDKNAAIAWNCDENFLLSFDEILSSAGDGC